MLFFQHLNVIRKLKTCTSITPNGNLRVRVGWLGSGLFEDVCRPRYNDRTFHFPLPTGNLFATLRGGVEKKIKCRLPESLNKLSMFSQPQLHLQQQIAIYQTQTGRFQPFFVDILCVVHIWQQGNADFAFKLNLLFDRGVCESHYNSVHVFCLNFNF